MGVLQKEGRWIWEGWAGKNTHYLEHEGKIFIHIKWKVHSGTCVRSLSIALGTCPQQTPLFGNNVPTPFPCKATLCSPCCPTWVGWQHAQTAAIRRNFSLIPFSHRFLYSSDSLAIQLLEKTVYNSYAPHSQIYYHLVSSSVIPAIPPKLALLKSPMTRFFPKTSLLTFLQHLPFWALCPSGSSLICDILTDSPLSLQKSPS